MAVAMRQLGVNQPENKRQTLCTITGVAEQERHTGTKSLAIGNPPLPKPASRKPPMREVMLAFEESLDHLASFARGEKEPKSLTEKESMTAPASFHNLNGSEAIQAESQLEERNSPESLDESSRFALRDRVVLEHLPLVRAIAVRVHENLPVHVDLDDLVHAGIMGLFDAATKYDPDKNVAFSSYAKHRIKGAILDSLRQLDWASRDLRRRHKQVEAATRDLATELQRNPTEDEVASKLGVEVERWRQMMVDLRNVGLVSASTRSNDSEDLPAPEFPTSPDTHPDSICAKEELRLMLSTALRTLPERYQKVVMYYYANELTMKEIGGMLGINESRVSQIHKAALEKMANALAQAGISSAAAF